MSEISQALAEKGFPVVQVEEVHGEGKEAIHIFKVGTEACPASQEDLEAFRDVLNDLDFGGRHLIYSGETAQMTIVNIDELAKVVYDVHRGQVFLSECVSYEMLGEETKELNRRVVRELLDNLGMVELE